MYCKRKLGAVIFALVLGFSGLTMGSLAASEVRGSDDVAIRVGVGFGSPGYYGYRHRGYYRYPSYRYRYYRYPSYRARYYRGYYPYSRYSYYDRDNYWYGSGGNLRFYIGD